MRDFASRYFIFFVGVVVAFAANSPLRAQREYFRLNQFEIDKVTDASLSEEANRVAELLAKSIQAGSCHYGKTGLCSIESLEAELARIERQRANRSYSARVGEESIELNVVGTGLSVIVGLTAGLIIGEYFGYNKTLTSLAIFLGAQVLVQGYFALSNRLLWTSYSQHRQIKKMRDKFNGLVIERLEHYWGVKLTGQSLEEKEISLRHILGDVTIEEYILAFPEKIQAGARFWSAEVSATLEAAQTSEKFSDEELQLLRDMEQAVKNMAAEFHRTPRWGTRKKTWKSWYQRLLSFQKNYKALLVQIEAPKKLNWEEGVIQNQIKRFDLQVAPYASGRTAHAKAQFLKGTDDASQRFVEVLSDALATPKDKALQELYLKAAEQGELVPVQVMHEMIAPYSPSNEFQKRGLAKVTLTFQHPDEKPITITLQYHHRLSTNEQLEARGFSEPGLDKALRSVFKGGDLRLLSQIVSTKDLRHSVDFQSLKFPDTIGNGIETPLLTKVVGSFKSSKNPIADVWDRLKDEMMNIQGFSAVVDLKLSELKEARSEHLQTTPGRINVSSVAREAKRQWTSRLKIFDERIRVLNDLKALIDKHVEIRLKLADEITPYLDHSSDAVKVAELKSRVINHLELSLLPLKLEVQEKVDALKDASLQLSVDSGFDIEEVNTPSSTAEYNDSLPTDDPAAARAQAHAACGDATQRLTTDSLDGPPNLGGGSNSISQ